MGQERCKPAGVGMLSAHTEAINFAKCIEVRHTVHVCTLHSRCRDLYKIIISIEVTYSQAFVIFTYLGISI
jgi:hypothetical protein